ncbi:2-oxo acid dehydrogenase subunit E2 [Spiroplasma endosymbiont of Asaphidion curtum]|uniref:2-oxo acid dehydrogenase subunit E2 n=1 Tax=Spiroplasma endosymbiont of Asaphidion curtum TaxID=3066281 RepID=UPI00313F3C81
MVKLVKLILKLAIFIKTGDVFASSNLSNNVTSSKSNKSEESINKQVSSNMMETNPEKSNNKVLATPLARRMARELGIDITTIKGTGPNGRVLKQDLVGGHPLSSEVKSSKLVTEKPLAVAPPMQSCVDDISLKMVSQAEQRVKMTPTRKAIFKAMSNSVFTIPHTSLMTQVNVTALVQLRAQLKMTVIKPDFKLTYMPFFIRAVTMALKEFPIINARLDEVTEEIVYHNYYNIGIAADKMLAHVASAQRIVAVENILGKNSKMDMDYIASCIYSFPKIASVGLTEQQCQDKQLPFSSFKFPLLGNGKALADGEITGFVKLLANKRTGEIYGAHIISGTATDMIMGVTTTMVSEGTIYELAKNNSSSSNFIRSCDGSCAWNYW